MRRMMSHQHVGVIITGGDFQGLGVLRSLGEKSVPTITVDYEHCISRYSRHLGRFIKSPHPAESENYVNFLLDLHKKFHLDGWLIYPNNDEIAYVLSKNKNMLSDYFTIPTPEWEIFKYLYIKKETYQLADKHHIPIPMTYYPLSLEEALDMNIQFPVVIKPSIRPNFYNNCC